MDKNQIVGIVLIFTLFIAWQQFFAPTPEELQAEQAYRDSIAQVQQEAETPAAADLSPLVDTLQESAAPTTVITSDSVLLLQRSGSYGAFAAATLGEPSIQVLENDLMRVSVNTQGGHITEVLLKEHHKIVLDSSFKEQKVPLTLLDDPKNKFEYLLPVSGVPNGIVRTSELIFKPSLEGNTLRLRADAGPEQYVEQVYTIQDDSYLLDYDLNLVGLQQILANDAQAIELDWVNYLDKIEINENYERNYTSIYFKPAEDDVDRCSCTSTDEEASSQPVKWVAAANQFFTSAIFADDRFSGATVRTEMLDEDAPDLKKVEANIQLPYGHSPSESMAMQLYVGPNDFERMRAIGHDFTDVIPYGRSIFGAINRWVIRPIFNFFDNITGNKGVAIILLTLLVKLLVFPLTYKMLHSQSKMQAMKPYLEKVKSKHQDDQQAQQMETMKMYREYGVNPLGGCLPMALQMPIWFALYRFFPADITFRQEPFLWATDLSSYDVILRLPFEIPLGFGAHISLFAVLWAITTLIYTFYNTKHMDFGANPFMKYFQYIMPVMFLGFFNSFAAGLTAYLFFSNLFNITQTLVTKNFIIDQDKIREELEANKRKPKKKGGFQERLQAALAEQQKRQAELEAKRKKK